MYLFRGKLAESRRELLRILPAALLSAAFLIAREEKDAKKAKPDPPVYEPGGDVKPPKLIHYVEPEFSSSSKEAYVDGTVKISTIVNTDGLATELRVTSGLNSETDRTAVEAVKQWRFRPGTKAGDPVNVHVTVEVAFHLL